MNVICTFLHVSKPTTYVDVFIAQQFILLLIVAMSMSRRRYDAPILQIFIKYYFKNPRKTK